MSPSALWLLGLEKKRSLPIFGPWWSGSKGAERKERLSSSDLPALFRPAPNAWVEVPELPKLGTGKLDLRGLSDLAHAVVDAWGAGVDRTPIICVDDKYEFRGAPSFEAACAL